MRGEFCLTSIVFCFFQKHSALSGGKQSTSKNPGESVITTRDPSYYCNLQFSCCVWLCDVGVLAWWGPGTILDSHSKFGGMAYSSYLGTRSVVGKAYWCNDPWGWCSHETRRWSLCIFNVELLQSLWKLKRHSYDQVSHCHHTRASYEEQDSSLSYRFKITSNFLVLWKI